MYDKEEQEYDKRISDIFSAKYKDSLRNPPQTVEGHINHENSITNDYRGRAIYEFFQNAIDRANSRIEIHLNKNTKSLVVANDGESFSILESLEGQKRTDFEALCSVNTSSKNPNESIGNKGVGFKSCWEYTKKVSIFSLIDKFQWGFSFYNPLAFNQLPEDIININEWDGDDYQKVIAEKKQVPSFYFPLRNYSSDDVFNDYPWAKTIIKFEDVDLDKLDELEGKIIEFAGTEKGFNKTKKEGHQLFFINQIDKLRDKEVTLILKINDVVHKEIKTTYNKEDWLVVSEEIEGDDLNELREIAKALNYDIKKPKVAIAFPLKGQLIDSKYYCYLPTEINCGFNVLMHADFLLDVSRKYIDFKDNKFNKKLQELLIDLLIETLAKNEQLHKLPNFAEFINVTDVNVELRDKIWSKLTHSDTPAITNILRSVYNKESATLNKENSYQLLFSAMKSWIPNRKRNGEWAKYYNDVYFSHIRYFCDASIYIVYVNDGYVVPLPSKKDENEQKHSLFYIAKEEVNKNNSRMELLKDISTITISGFNELGDNLFINNNLVKGNQSIEIVRSLASFIEKDPDCTEEDKANILRFVVDIANQKSFSRNSFLKSGL